MSVPTMYALVLQVSPREAGRLPLTMGHQAHAAFLDAVKQADSMVAAELHKAQERRLFTVSELDGLRRDGRAGEVWVTPGEVYRLRVTLLDRDLYGLFMARFLSGEQRSFRFGQTTFDVLRVCGTPHGDEGAGASSLEVLWEEAVPRAVLGLRFVSSTAISRDSRRYVLFPEPAWVFKALASRWKQLGGAALDLRELEVYANEEMDVEAHHVWTQVWQVKGKPQLGFAGWVRYRCGQDVVMQRWLAALAGLAFFTGVGGRTSYGMGQVRVLSPKEVVDG